MICFLSIFTRYFDGYLIKKNKSFAYLSKLKLLIFKRIYEKKVSHNNKLYQTEDIIVSLTVIESRLYFLKYTLNSLITQTFRPKKIIVNYDDSIDQSRIEIFVKLYKDDGVVFRQVENYGSHKKYLFLNDEERKLRVLLCDDDMIYDKWLIEHLIKSSINNTSYVSTLFGYKMCDDKNNILKREDWKFLLKCNNKSNLYFFTGNAFTLYPKNFFDDNILCKKDILFNFKNPETGVIGYDDSWLNFHRLKKKIEVFYARPYSKFFWPACIINPKFSLGSTSKKYWFEGRVFERLFENYKKFK